MRINIELARLTVNLTFL